LFSGSSARGLSMARRIRVLQDVQDQLADLSNLSIVLFHAKGLKSLILSDSNISYRKLRKVYVTKWSKPEEYLHILCSNDLIFHEYISLLRSQIEDINTNIERDNWRPQVFPGPLGVYHFIAPISKLSGREGKAMKRRVVYYLFGGSLQFPDERKLSWGNVKEYLEKLETKTGSELSHSLRHQILGEILNVSTWLSPKVVFNEIEVLQLTLNGIIRSYLEEVEPPKDILSSVAELHHSVRQRDRFRSGLESALEIVPLIRAAFVAIKHVKSGTGFLAMRVPAHPNEELKDQWLFIPRPEDIQGFLQANKFEDTPKRERKYLDFNFNLKFERKFQISARDTGDIIGALWLFSDKSPKTLRRDLPKDELKRLEGFLASCRNYLIPNEEQISHAIFKAQQRNITRRRNQLDHHVSKPAFLETENLRLILEETQDIIGFQKAVYYQARLYKDRPEGFPLASWPTSEAEPLLIAEQLREKLFIKMEPHYENNTVYQPLISGDRTLAFLKFFFEDEKDLEAAKPLIIEFGNQLAARIPHRRLSKCVDEVMKQVQRLTKDPTQDRKIYNKLAEQAALLVGEPACSVWIYDEIKKEFECIGRAGVTLTLSKIHRYDKEALVVRSYESSEPVKANLDNPQQKVIARNDLKRREFRQGIGVSSTAGGTAVVIVVWSKSKYKEDYFKPEDDMVLRLLAFILSQVISLQRHLVAQSRIRDETMVHLGHELRSPLGAVYSAIELLQRYPFPGKPHSYILNDIMGLINYALFMVKNLLLFAQIEGLAEIFRIGEKKPYKLFDDIIFKIIDTLKIHVEGRGLDIQCNFPPGTFPEHLYLTETEKSFLESIVFNLLWNAIKYSTPERSTIIRGVGKVLRDRIHIKVQNYGIGVIEGEETMIFEKCKRGSNADQGTPPEGSGLGLYVASRLAGMLDGELALSSHDNPTEFILALPLRLSQKPDV